MAWMKKYCMILAVMNLICIGIFVFQRYAEDWQTYSERTDTKAAGETAQGMEHGSSQEDIYWKDGDEKPRIAITFDDGPNSVWTPFLLDGLKERGVKATFFVIGEKAQESQEIIKRMYEEGHIIGNHTFSHVQLTNIGNTMASEEINKTNQVIYEITGEYPQFIRPPFGSWSDNLECGVEMFPVMWNIDTLDWTTSNTDGVVQKAVRQAKDNSIILLHDNYESSVKAALRIIDTLQEKGFEFVTVEELMFE